MVPFVVDEEDVCDTAAVVLTEVAAVRGAVLELVDIAVDIVVVVICIVDESPCCY